MEKLRKEEQGILGTPCTYVRTCTTACPTSWETGSPFLKIFFPQRLVCGSVASDEPHSYRLEGLGWRFTGSSDGENDLVNVGKERCSPLANPGHSEIKSVA